MFDAVTYAAAVAAAKQSSGGVRFFSTNPESIYYITPAELAPLIENGERFKIETFVDFMGEAMPVLLDSGLFVASFGVIAASTIMYTYGMVVLAQLATLGDGWNTFTKLLSATDIPD